MPDPCASAAGTLRTPVRRIKDRLVLESRFVGQRLDRLLAVVQKEDREQIVSIADWFAEQGRQDALRTALLRMLRTRFGTVPEAAAARIQAAETGQLNSWLDRLLTASSLDEVLASA